MSKNLYQNEYDAFTAALYSGKLEALKQALLDTFNQLVAVTKTDLAFVFSPRFACYIKAGRYIHTSKMTHNTYGGRPLSIVRSSHSFNGKGDWYFSFKDGEGVSQIWTSDTLPDDKSTPAEPDFNPDTRITLGDIKNAVDMYGDRATLKELLESIL